MKWHVRDEGGAFDTVEADDSSSALETAFDSFDRSVYPSDKPLFLQLVVQCAETGEIDSETRAYDANEPKCSSEHDWKDTGMSGHGGGILFRSQCIVCGCVRERDTWAHDPSTGHAPYDVTSYRTE